MMIWLYSFWRGRGRERGDVEEAGLEKMWKAWNFGV